MEQKFRCDCPITTALDVLGDKWMLVIVKQMLIDGKRTFKDFRESDEAVSSNILSTKLKLLEKVGILFKSKLPNNKKTVLYNLTERGLALTPVVVELAVWSYENMREFNSILRKGDELSLMKSDKAAFAEALVQKYKEEQAKILSQGS
ncbi:MAG: helix-turn-helix domain-containing protein [Bacteroidota bacterium]